MQVWNVLHAARWKYSMQKIAKKLPSGHHSTTMSSYIFATKACIDNLKKNLLSSNISSTCPHNMVNFGPLAAEIIWLVWGTPTNFNGFCVLAVLLHGTLVVGVCQTLRHWTEGATYIRQGSHHVGHWTTFLVVCNFVKNQQILMHFSPLDLTMNVYVWQYELHPLDLINVATLPCESQNSENVILQWDITKENCIKCIVYDS